MEVQSFAEIEQEFIERVHRMVWCNLGTVDPLGRPRSRIVHPVWEGAISWITTRRNSHKGKHISQNPYVSLGYVSDLAKPVYADGRAEWIDDLVAKQHIWDYLQQLPAPAGFDPAPIYKAVDDPNFGLLKVTPWRIELVNLPEGKPQVWHAQAV